MILAVTDKDFQTSIIIWACVLIVATIAFFVVMHFARGFFSTHWVYEIYKDGKKNVKKITYVKDGSEVEVSRLKMMNEYKDSKVLIIQSDADIKEGTTASFIMPHGDVYITYALKSQKPFKVAAQPDINKAFIPLPEALKAKSEEAVRPVLLLDTEDVIEHLSNSNSDKDFPLINYYRSTVIDDKDILILFVGDAIYGVVVSSEAVFKCLIRSDSLYIKNDMKEIDTIASIKNDIYSFVLDSSFTSQKEFFNALDHAYHYTLLAAYPEIEGKLVLQEEATKKANSAILGYNEKVSREFDPVYDRAILEARKYKAKMAQIAKIEEQLDAKMFSPKDLVYQELGKIDEVLTFTKPDEYKVPLDEIFDGPYVEKKPKVVEEVVVKVPSVQDALLSLDKLSPSVLSIDNFIDYVMSRKEMVSLTIDLSQNYKKEPTTMKIFEASYFALIFETAPSFVIDLKLDLSYVDELRKKHPHIVHILNGSQDDWYMLVMDETFSSYEELYDIALTSYRYTKAIYYKNREADQDAASAA